jgi:hypothetical protein
MPKKKYAKAPFCKPCWELRYCPYGYLVEYMPLPSPAEERAEREKRYNETGQEMYERAKQELRETDFSNEDKFWRQMQFVMYADPFKHDAINKMDPAEVRCNIFGHACPVFYYGVTNVSETKELRKTGRYIPHDIMLKVVRRDDYHCRECGERVRDDEVEFDHVIPHSKGGPLTVENIRLLCRPCNRKKSDSLKTILDT